VADIVSFGSDKPPRPPPRRVIVGGVVVLSAALLVVAAVVASRGGGKTDGAAPAPASPALTVTPVTPETTGPPCLPVGWAQRPAVAKSPAALVIGPPQAGREGGLERCDRTAVDGPWTVVVRRPDGSLGRHGAVVTFPVHAPTGGRGVRVGKASGKAGSGSVVWPVAGAYARVRGDLAEHELISIAAGTAVAGGRPSVSAPAGYLVVSAGPYRPPVIHEVRYGSAEVGEGGALGGGLTYTGVLSGGGFEDQLYAVQTQDGGIIDGKPAVMSPVFGGNATLAWEPSPGLVAYVGYSGAAADDVAVAALRRLAGKARALTGAEFHALHPPTADQTNDPG
jgi:hypothetical protein